MTTRKPNSRVTLITILLMAFAVAAPYIDISDWAIVTEPNGPRQVVILHETGDSTWRWNSMLLALRSWNTDHKIFIYDDDADIGVELKNIFNGQQLPAVSILTLEGKVLFTGDMPTEIAGAKALIEKYGG